MRRVLVFIALMLVTAQAGAQLTQAERQGISDTLYIANLSTNDLARPSTATSVLDEADNLLALHALSANRSVAQLLGQLRTKVYNDPESPDTPTSQEVVVPDEVPEAARPSVQKLVQALLDADEFIRQATSKLSPEEKRTLIEALPRLATGQPSIKFEFVKQPMPDRASILALLSKCDLAKLRYGAQRLAQTVQEELPKLKEIAPQIVLEKPLKTTVSGLVVEIGGTENDLHDSSDTVLCLDFGGNDRYTGRYGAGVGYAALAIDVAGDDTYDVPDLSVGAAELGIGLAYDLGGEDIFKGRSICFGSGLAGVGVLLKDGENDEYRSTALAQGFGFYGIGILLDTKGNDRYQLGLMGQGAGLAKGIGWLIDKAGDDIYRSGGLVESTLYKGWRLSQAQAYGEGEGGLGLLSDLQGTDAYLGEIACQAAARDRGLASLYDASGDDTYNATHEAQASASRSAGAYLFDLAGDDGYMVKSGACHAFGHDYGTAFLLDRAGSDVYAARDSRPASANANGLAVFLDAAGEDRYFGPPGVGNPARGTGSLAVFCDLGGSDVYAGGLADGTASANSTWSASYDAISYAPKPKPLDPNVPTERSKPGSKPMPPDADLEALFKQAASGTPDEIDKATDNLIAIGEPAVKWMLDKKLTTANEDEIRAIAAVVNGVGSSAKFLAAKEIDAKEDAKARNAILVCQEANIKEAVLTNALKRPALARVATRAAGALGAKDCVPELLSMTGSEFRTAVFVSLAQIGDARAYEKMEPLLNSEDLVLRKAAIELVAKFPERSLSTAKKLIAGPGERQARTGIEILAALGTPEAMNEAGKALSDPRRGVKIQALLAIDRRCPKEFRETLTELRKSPDPLIAAVAARIDPGR